jgi:surfactin family lipopeptide synthetase A
MNSSEARSSLLEKYMRGELSRSPVTPARTEREHALSLSLSQEQVWLRSQATVGMPPPYNETIVIYRSGSLNLDALRKSLLGIIRRHEAWRTTFDMRDGQVCQLIHPTPKEFPLFVADLRARSRAEAEVEAVRLANQRACQPFDLQRGPLVRGMLVSFSGQEHRLYLNMHQIIVDGISGYKLLPTELSSLYESFVTGASFPQPDLPFQFADFAMWQRNWLQGEVLQGQLNYWRRQFSRDIPVLCWPNHRRRPPLQTYRGAMQPFATTKQVLESAKAASRAARASLFAVLVATLAALLHAYTKQDDITLGTLAPSGRIRTEFQHLLGYFLNPVALRLQLSRIGSFGELILQAQRTIAGAISCGDVPLEHVVDSLGLRLDPSRHPLFQVAISLAPLIPPLPPGWDMTAMDPDSGGARWDLYLVLSERPDYFLGRTQYNPDLFNQATISAFLEDFQVLLREAGSNLHKKLSDVLDTVINNERRGIEKVERQ